MSQKSNVFVIPFMIAFSNGVLSVMGVSSGYEVYFWTIAILMAGILLLAEPVKNPLKSALIVGLIIAAGTGLPQAIFMETYFANNPDYLELADQLPINARTYTLAMIPVFGSVIGLVLYIVCWISYKITR